jgi:signal transduction histidine kinase
VSDSGQGGTGRALRALGDAVLRGVHRLGPGRVERAVEAERRRLARELHDGVVQELGWIRSAAVRQVDHDQIVAAADRALADARRVIRGGVDSADEPLAAAFERVVRDVAARHDVRLHLELDERTTVPSGRGQDLVRIAGEAVANAGRHGRPTTVSVRLVPGRLHVHDDGCGFELAAVGTRGHGLTSMRERAEAFGGRFSVTSSPEAGTTVGVEW